jgi:hypothetical protein
MSRLLPLAAFTLILTAPTPARADAFDFYINPVLGKVPDSPCAKEIKQLDVADLTEVDQVIPDANAALLMVKTNDTRYAKLLVTSARRKITEEKTLPILLIDRFVTYRPGEDQAFHAIGKNVNLFNGFRFSLDLGQVVPEEVGGDLKFTVDGAKLILEPIGKAKMYLITKPLPEALPKKGAKLVVGEKFEAKYWDGKYKLFDDGRRTGMLTFNIDEQGTVRGTLVSDKDGKTYNVNGKVGKEKHAIDFTVTLPRTEQTFTGWMFTGDGKAIVGSSKMLAGAGQQAREMGFYAVRIEE